MSGCIRDLSILHSPVFLLNSCLDLFSAPYLRRDPFSRSYRVNLPSSLTVIHSSALVYSTRLRVSVYGTGTLKIKFSGFSWKYDYMHYYIVLKERCILSGSTLAADLPTAINIYTLQRTIPSVRGIVTTPSPRHSLR